ncbi:type I pullulanase [Caldicellulosiruptoraceae bacterium PP1]
MKTNFNSRRILATFLLIIFALTLVPIASLADDNKTTLIIHYYRYNEDYQGWNLWIWPTKPNSAEGNAYAFTQKDDFGMVAKVELPGTVTEAGIIVRKGNWEAKDVGVDRFIKNINGTKEVWLIESEQPIYETQPQKTPKQTAYLDGLNTIVVKLAKKADISQKDALQGFSIKAFYDDIKIKKVEPVLPKVTKNVKPEDVGYELIDGGSKVRFILKPNSGDFKFTDTSGKLEVYLSGTMNDWGGTSSSEGKYKPLPNWKLTWNSEKGYYELIKDFGKDGINFGAKFKFTSWDGNEATWYPGGMGNDKVLQELYTGNEKITKVDQFKITTEDELEPQVPYTVSKNGFKSTIAIPRNILDNQKYFYNGNDLGSTYSQNSTSFRLWAPTAINVILRLYDDYKTNKYKEYEMQQSKNGTWFYKIPGNLKGKYYQYEVWLASNSLTDDTIRKNVVPDPYSKATSANSERTLIFDPKDTNPVGWENDSFVKTPNQEDAIIYETHVRDFTIDATSGIRPEFRGKYLGFTQENTKGPNGVKTGISHLKELGITHVHLLPTYDFATVDENKVNSGYNWGYDPVLYQNVEGSYATNPNGIARIKEYKQMVMALHKNGIGIIQDVVFNHTAQIGEASKFSIFDKIVPGYFYRLDKDGNYSNGSGIGNEVASEKPMVRKFIIDTLKYLTSEYHIDGYRFDLMAAIDRITMAQSQKEVREINPSAIFYGEGWLGGASALSPELRMEIGSKNQAGLHIAFFNDRIREAIRGNLDNESKGFMQGNYQNRPQDLKNGIKGAIDEFATDPDETINYVSAHDNLTLWDKLQLSAKNESDEVKDKMGRLANAIVLTTQGIPFLHGGVEFNRTKYMNNNSYNAGDKINKYDWNLKVKWFDTFKYYQGLIELRKAHSAFRLTTAEDINKYLKFIQTPSGTVGYELSYPNDTWNHIIVVYNATKQVKEINLPEGNWVVVGNGDEVGTTPIKKLANYVSSKAFVAPISTFIAYKADKFPDGYKLDKDTKPVSLATASGDNQVKVYGQGDVTVEINVTVPQGTDDDIIYIAGSFAKIDMSDWNPGDADNALELIKVSQGNYKVIIKANDGDVFEYKYTRGSWATVEKGANKEEINNRKIVVKADQNKKMVIDDKIANWADK